MADPSLAWSHRGPVLGGEGCCTPPCLLPAPRCLERWLWSGDTSPSHSGTTCPALGTLSLLGKVSGSIHPAFANPRRDSVSPLCSHARYRVLRFLPASSSPASGSLPALVRKDSPSPGKREQSRGQVREGRGREAACARTWAPAPGHHTRGTTPGNLVRGLCPAHGRQDGLWGIRPGGERRDAGGCGEEAPSAPGLTPDRAWSLTPPPRQQGELSCGTSAVGARRRRADSARLTVGPHIG